MIALMLLLVEEASCRVISDAKPAATPAGRLVMSDARASSRNC